jgi:hypothetical protein
MKQQTRREFLKTAAVGTAALSAPAFPRVSRGAGKLALGLWDHWVKPANNVVVAIIEEWGKANKVEVQVDFFPTIGDKLQLTAAAESRAGAGHDVITLWQWDAIAYKDKLEPMNDIAEEIQKRHGPYTENAKYLTFQDGKWIALPSAIGSHTYPLETRMDLWKQHAGIDVVDLFPPDAKKRSKAKVDAWDWKKFLEGAKKVHAAGFPFATAISNANDANQWLSSVCLSYGSVLVNEKGEITVESDATLAALEYLKELTKYMPPEVYGWDDAGNNRYLIAGKGSAIFNPPSAWAVAKRDRPEVAAQVWHHDVPRGPKGRFRGSLLFTWGVWKFGKNKSAAKDLLLHLSVKDQQWRLITAGEGYDVPQLPAFYDHPIWNEIGPPTGGQYNYMVRGDERLIIPGWPAKPEMAQQLFSRWILPTMVGKVTSAGMAPREAMKWAAKELEAYKRG